ncbi:MAG: HAD family phosphatase [Muribaculaceae bacterium]|nr:HAD family phosphatase [Muribaculaceae bacterium]
MSTLYVSDLDGTLLNAESKVSDESAALINSAIADGALFSVATARTPATVSRLLKDVHINVPLIVMTGAAIWDMARNRYLHVAFHDEDIARRLLETYRRHSLSTFVYTLGEDNIIHIYHTGPMSDLEWKFVDERKDSPFKEFHIPDTGCSVFPERLDRVLLFYNMRPTPEVFPVYEEIRSLPGIRPVFYHDIFGEETAIMEVFGEGASKAEAVRILADMINADRVVAYGDNVNDLPILGIADDAVAVSNAVAEVKNAADRVIGPNTDHSVARDIVRLTTLGR